MMWHHATVQYRYRRSATGAWTSSRWAGLVRQRSEHLVMQAVRQNKPNCEIELIYLDWRG